MAAILSYYRDHPGYYNSSPLFPDPIVCVRDMATQGAYEFYERLPWNGLDVWLKECVDWINFTVYFDCWAFIWPLIIAVLLTMGRVFCNFIILKRIPVWLKLTRNSSEKFPESVWKFIIYSITWSWAIYILIYGKDNYFFNLKSHCTNWHPSEVIEAPLFWLYMFQMGFYLHCVYATLVIRKDFSVLMGHHFVTLCLLLFSYLVRFQRIGLLVLFVQGIGDVLLELAKTILYLKTRDGKDYAWPEFFANLAFACVALQHILFRLYWYPVKVVYSTLYVCVVVYPCGPFYLIFNMLLIILYMMQVYWLKFIIILAIKSPDTRDYAEETEDEKQKKGPQSGAVVDTGVHRYQREKDGSKGEKVKGPSSSSSHLMLVKYHRTSSHLVSDHCNQFYQVGVEKVKQGQVSCRNVRWEMVGCESEADFLAKLYCVRLAFSKLLCCQDNRDSFMQLGREIMCSFLTSVGSDPAKFSKCYDNLLEYLQDDDNWKIAKDELQERKVVSMNVYDVALDFVLLDAFCDLEHPPSTIVKALQKRWLSEGMKKSALSVAVWTLLKAKRSRLTNSDGFMSRFYDLSYTIIPGMAWGLLGTDQQLVDRCSRFKDMVLQFVQCIFSLESVCYESVDSLADDILQLALRTADSMKTL